MNPYKPTLLCLFILLFSHTLNAQKGVPKGKTVYLICEVTDSGTPQLTRYQRLVVEIE